MQRILIVAVVGLLVAVAALGSIVAFGQGDSADALATVDCQVDVTPATDESQPATGVATCTGTVEFDTPLGTQTIEFTLVVEFADNPPDGPSFSDDIISCTLTLPDGTVPITAGPCS